jgi:hypothetical protein
MFSDHCVCWCLYYKYVSTGKDYHGQKEKCRIFKDSLFIGSGECCKGNYLFGFAKCKIKGRYIDWCMADKHVFCMMKI